jgi:hypothetical protein
LDRRIVVGHGYFGRASELMAIKVEIPRIRPYLGAPDSIASLLMNYRGDYKENKVDEQIDGTYPRECH